MSASEIIARYQVTGCVADFIETDIRHAHQFTIWAEQFRQIAREQHTSASLYVRAMNDSNVERYMAQARADGHIIRTYIQEINRKEVAIAQQMVEAGEVAFWSGSCADETCGDCGSPMWHHLVNMEHGILCPKGRNYWQFVRALDAGRYAPDVRIQDTLVGVIARRV